MTLFAAGHASSQTSSDQDLMTLNIEELTQVKLYSPSRHMEGMRKLHPQ